MDSFTTEFGHTIPFVPNYFERNRAYGDVAVEELHPGLTVESNPLSPHFPAKDWVSFSAMMYFLQRHDLLKRWETGIDLGGAESTCIRLLKATGWIKHATNISPALSI